MKKTLIALIAVTATGFGASALGDESVTAPVLMTNIEMDAIVAGMPGWACGDMGGAQCMDTTDQLWAPVMQPVGPPSQQTSRPTATGQRGADGPGNTAWFLPE